jgi:hypothetical protein
VAGSEPDSDPLLAELCALLSQGGRRLPVTDATNCPLLIEMVAVRLAIPSDEARSLARKVIELAVVTDESSAPERPLLAARLLLWFDLPPVLEPQDLPARVGRTIDEIHRSSSETRRKRILKFSGELVTHRRTLAGATHDTWKDRTYWVRDGKGTKFAATGLLDRICELLDDDQLVARVGLKSNVANPPGADLSAPAHPGDRSWLDRWVVGTRRYVLSRRGNRRLRSTMVWVVALFVVLYAISWAVNGPPWRSNGPKEASKPSMNWPMWITVSAENVTTGEGGRDSGTFMSAVLGDELRYFVKMENRSNAAIDVSQLVVEIRESRPDYHIAHFELESPDGLQLSDGVDAGIASDPPDCVAASKPAIKSLAVISTNPNDMSDSFGPVGHAAGKLLASGWSVHGKWMPGETRRVEVVVDLVPSERSEIGFFRVGRDSMVLRRPREPSGVVVAKALPGDEFVGMLKLDENSCSTEAHASRPLVRLQFNHHASNGYSRVVATGTDRFDDAVSTSRFLGGSVLNYVDDGPRRLVVVPGSTALYAVGRKACGSPRLVRHLPDGIANGGVIVGPIFGYVPHAKCGANAHVRWIRFRMRVE